MPDLSPRQRRNRLLKQLKEADGPVTGNQFSERFDVSRQVIVQDIALLRAEGQDILATSQGYLIPQSGGNNLRSTLACQHGEENVREELMIMIRYGAKVIDVIVEHPFYGELRGMLMLESREDVDRFLQKLEKKSAGLLCALTGGVHLHTVEVLNVEVYRRLKAALLHRGFLVSED